MKQHARDPFREDVWEPLAEGMHYISTEFGDEEFEHRLARPRREDRRGARHRRQPRLLLRRAAGRDRDARPGGRKAPQHGGLDAPRHREAVRTRPRLRARADGAAAGALHRGRDLPDRPLPRQGDRPEHAGAPLLERHLRADLEQAVHRPRADHGGGDDGHRGPLRLLRAGGRSPRHLPEPPAPAARADGDGAADRLHVGAGAQ